MSGVWGRGRGRSTHPKQWQQQDTQVREDVKGGDGDREQEAAQAVRGDVGGRAPQVVDVAAALEDGEKEGDDRPEPAEGDQAPRRNVEGPASEDVAVEEEDGDPGEPVHPSEEIIVNICVLVPVILGMPS